MLKIIPKQDRVVVRQLPREEITKGGIFIPKTAVEQNRGFFRGTVVAVGPGKVDEKGTLVPIQAQIGQVVMFGQYSGLEVILEDDNNEQVSFMVVRDGDIVGEIVEEPPVTVESISGDGPKS